MDALTFCSYYSKYQDTKVLSFSYIFVSINYNYSDVKAKKKIKEKFKKAFIFGILY